MQAKFDQLGTVTSTVALKAIAIAIALWKYRVIKKMAQALIDSHRKTRKESTPVVEAKVIVATVANGKTMITPIPGVGEREDCCHWLLL